MLDAGLTELLRSHRPPAASQAPLFGLSYPSIRSRQVTVYAVCRNESHRSSTAAYGLYWGQSSSDKESARLPGTPQTLNRTYLFALIRALQRAPPADALYIYTCSEYLTQSLTHLAPSHAAIGWAVRNGDLLRHAAALLRSRSGPVDIQLRPERFLSGHPSIGMAEVGASLPAVPMQPFPAPRDSTPPQCAPLARPKILTNAPPPTNGYAVTHTDAHYASIGLHQLPLRLTHPGVDEDIARVQRANRMDLINSPTGFGFWKAIHRLLETKPRPPAVTPLQIRDAFHARVNLSSDPPPHFDLVIREIRRLEAELIPQFTLNGDPRGRLNRPISAEDVERAKVRIVARAAESARGDDDVSYLDLLPIPNEELAAFLNDCLRLANLPTTWLYTKLIALLKSRRPPHELDSYRAIALESCPLKLFTSILHDRIREWVEEMKILPPHQTGFRANFRATNNIFILQAAAFRAQARHRPLYVAFVDLTNAFPSVDRPTLWLKLHQLGFTGPVFDCLRVLYRHMRYYTTSEGSRSEDFLSDGSILMGDPPSSSLFTIYTADFRTSPDDDDITLAGLRTDYLGHADDLALISTSARGLQAKLNQLLDWCRLNYMIINAIKSEIAIFGGLPSPLPAFFLGAAPVEIKTTLRYLGLHLRSSPSEARIFFDPHYAEMAASAARAANVSFALEKQLGTFSPAEGRMLYFAHVEPYLIYGADVIPDTNETCLGLVESVQAALLKRLLPLPTSTPNLLAQTELDLPYLPTRRALLNIDFFTYAISQPPDRAVHRAALDTLHLVSLDRPSWLSAVQRSIDRIDASVRLPSEFDAYLPPNVSTVRSLLKSQTAKLLLSQLHGYTKLPLLQLRYELSAQGRPIRPLQALRSYLSIPCLPHRNALLSILASSHHLAEEELRHRAARREPRVPPVDRLCRLCLIAQEQPLHALFHCNDPILQPIRTAFLASLPPDFLARTPPFADVRIPHLRISMHARHDHIALFLHLLATPEMHERLAAYVHDVLAIYDDRPAYIPEVHAP